MPISHRLLITAAALAIAACSAAPFANEPAADEPGNAAAPTNAAVAAPAPDAAAAIDYGPDIILEGQQVLVDAGHGLRIPIDHSTLAEVETAMRYSGEPKRSEGPSDCPAGKLSFLDYPNGLQLAIRDGMLVGYWVKEGSHGIATKGGVRPGSPRSALGKVEIADASFGKLAEIDGVTAVLDDAETKVTDLYAGAACIYD